MSAINKHTFWVGINAGGSLKLAWNDKEKCWYYPLFTDQDVARMFWDKQPDGGAWAIWRKELEIKL